MTRWPDSRLATLLGVEVPIVQAPMAGASDAALAIAVSRAGGLGSLPCAMLKPEAIRAEVASVRAATDRPLNLNFFCHTPIEADSQQQARWTRRLQSLYEEFGLSAHAPPPGPARVPFDATSCELVEALRPEVVSFHFGLPAPELLASVKAAGCVVLGSATTVAEACWLEAQGADAVIAQGAEAGGHRGMFLVSEEAGGLTSAVASQPGTLALVPQICDAVRVPVIAAGGIGDGRGIAAVMMLGASGVQIGTAFLFTQEARISKLHRAALDAARADDTVLTNVFTGRPARSLRNRAVRELGPLNVDAPAFPHAGAAMAPLRAAAEGRDSGEFSPLWSGQGAPLGHQPGRDMGAGDLVRQLSDHVEALLREIASGD
ncbi:MAG: nitronate monooxygenase [Pseudomonadales bacterium]|nr:nitronate monooxygenase [Pseudomonadales bacterium]